MKIKGGTVEEVRDEGSADGTVIEVRNIFFNTPARLKFMRSISTETGHISDTVTRLALAYPSIRFRLYNDNAPILETSVKSDLKARISDVFGRDFLSAIIPVEAGDGSLKLYGFIAKPEEAYSSTKGLFIYVNNRWIRDRGINHAIANGYRNCLGEGKYPFVVLFISILPQHVDVNVHPAKSEVRFKNLKDVYELVKNGIEAALAPSHVSFVKPYESKIFKQEVREDAAAYDNISQSPEQALPLYQPDFAESSENVHPSFFTELEVIGQLWQEYLLCEREGEFYIIDQHAAAERVAFEKLKKDYYADCRVSSQMLLMPQKIELSMQEMDAMENSLGIIKDIGFDIEPFGGNTFIIRAVPDMLSGIDCRGLIKEMTDELASVEISSKIEGRLDDILMRVACHSVIRGKRRLSKDEAGALLKSMAKVDFSGNCPHGRPVIKAITRIEIEKMFKRR